MQALLPMSPLLSAEALGFVGGDGLSQVRLVLVAAPGIQTKSDVAEGELVEVEHRDVVSLLEHDAKHAAFVWIAEQQDVERCAGHAVTVILDILDAEFHGHPLIRGWRAE